MQSPCVRADVVGSNGTRIREGSLLAQQIGLCECGILEDGVSSISGRLERMDLGRLLLLRLRDPSGGSGAG
jgi:hypothetical protein